MTERFKVNGLERFMFNHNNAKTIKELLEDRFKTVEDKYHIKIRYHIPDVRYFRLIF